jgi:putative endonuclease
MRNTGSEWEAVVENHLRKSGLSTLAKNFYSRYGEIDLVMRDGGDIVFVEVRYRKSATRGAGLDSVGAGKRTKLIRTASMFLQSQRNSSNTPCRFDVVSCSGTPDAPQIDWIRNAFEAH